MMRHEKHVVERSVKDLAEHVVTVKHADGMYRHWQCANPKSCHLHFDVVTWPGYLAFTGDMGIGCSLARTT